MLLPPPPPPQRQERWVRSSPFLVFYLSQARKKEKAHRSTKHLCKVHHQEPVRTSKEQVIDFQVLYIVVKGKEVSRGSQLLDGERKE